MKNRFAASSSRGSALLIVLGFLSFMMISAVSFAIYMRIERQASSNYRHALVARHLLTSALVRSIAEVDNDLDPDLRTDTIKGDVFRFPSHSLKWGGADGTRVFLSDNVSSNGGFARVGSFDSFGYIPALFMNDLRYYGADACWGQLGAPAERVRSATVNNGIPTFYFGGTNVVGRYAFACLNMSDLLNVNLCTNLSVRNTRSSRICMSYLLRPAAISDLETRFGDDIYYPTILDFYAGMHQVGATAFPDSPYHAWASGSQMSAASQLQDTNHIFVTDGFARIQKPRIQNTQNLNEDACNIKKNATATSLVAGSWDTKFTTAMNSALPQWRNFVDVDSLPIFKDVLAEYLALPSLGAKRLDIPSVKMAPMVYQIALAHMDPKTRIITEGTPPNQTKICSVLPVGDGGVIQVGLMFPFRNAVALANRSFTVDAELNIYLLEGDPDASTAPAVAPAAVPLVTPTVTGTASITVPSSLSRESDCFQSVAIPVSVPEVRLTGTAYDGKRVRVVMVVFATVRQGGNYFDSVPHRKGMVAGAPITGDRNKMVVPKLYFQQSAAFLVSDALAERTWPLEYYSLTCPDPRYNFAAANWYSSASQSITDGAGMLQALRSANLLGSDGRDSDVFMFASGQGELQSPGELGFLVRPFNNSSSVTRYTSLSESLRSRTTISQLADYDAFYRTVRLYDHGGTDPTTQLQDPIYEWFYAANEDDSVDGARINPHSDLPMVLMAAIAKTPLDYYYAYENRTSTHYEKKTFDASTGDGGIDTGWGDFSRAWMARMRANQPYLVDDTKQYKNKLLYEIYGSSQAPYNWGWYSGDTKRIFNAALSNGDLFEVDRKMLYSFSLESFSDRQQLFLYVIQAEATGTAVGSSSKSLAGGRAIAVVWRDPEVNKVSKRHDTQILYYRQLDN